MAESSTLVQWDAERNEPFIPLPSIPDLRLSPLRLDDIPGIVRLCNDPRVGKYSRMRPYPYTESNAVWLFDNYGESNRKNVQKLEAWMKDRSSARPLVQFPLQALRYVPSKAPGADGAQSKLEGLNVVEGEFIGNLHLIPQELDGKIENMLELPPQEQAWIVAYDILPNLQGRGIGKAMLRAGIEGWIRWLGIGTVLAHVQIDNAPSSGLLRSIGFERQGTEIWDWPETSGGGQREVVRWAYSTSINSKSE